jgi:hypothetical protein
MQLRYGFSSAIDEARNVEGAVLRRPGCWRPSGCEVGDENAERRCGEKKIAHDVASDESP